MRLFTTRTNHVEFSETARQMLVMAAQGYCNEDIAKHFETSEQTVKNAFKDIYNYMGASNRAHAVVLCYERGILECPRCRREKELEQRLGMAIQ